MFNSILVPLDGSLLAECVLPHIGTIAKAFDSEVILMRLLEKNQPNSSAQLFDLLNWQINKSQASLYLDKVKTKFQDLKIRAISTVQEGLVAEGIVEYAQSKGIKLIVLSTHGHSGLSQWGISSISQKVILNAPTSVLIIRASQVNFPFTEVAGLPQYQRILVPLDGSLRAENVFPIVLQMTQNLKSEIHIVHVIQSPEMPRQMPPSREDIELANRVVTRNKEEASHYFNQLQTRSSLESMDIHTHLLTSDNAATALHQFVEQENFDMVILSAHGYSGNHQWPYGGMVNNFITYGKVPLLILQDQPARSDTSTLNIYTNEHLEH